MLQRILLFLYLLLPAFAARGQQYPARHYSTEDGLPHSNVFRIYQDRSGFLWFSTDYGLARFDGRSFHTDFPDTAGFLNNAIMSVSESPEGYKLVSTMQDGILRLAPTGLQPLIPARDPLQSAGYATSFRNRVWALGFGGVTKRKLYRIQGGHSSEVVVRNASGARVLFNKISAYPDELLLATTDGLYRIRDTETEPLFSQQVQGEVTDVRRGRNGEYWIGCKRQIILARSDGTFHQYRLQPRQVVKDILPDREGRLWIALDGEGLLLLQEGRLEDITGRLAFGKVPVNDMLEDFEGNIWFATYGAGLYRVNSVHVLHYRVDAHNTNIFCRALSPVDGRGLLIGTIGKVHILEHGAVRRLPVQHLKPDWYIYFLRYFDGVLYAGTPYGLLVRKLQPPYTEQLLTDRLHNGSLSCCRSRDGRIWVGGYSFLQELKHGRLIQQTSPVPGEIRYNVLTEDHLGQLWLGTSEGLFVRRGDTYQQQSIPWPRGQRINDIVEDSRHRIWVATDHGLICIRGDSVQVLTRKDGLGSDRCNKLVEDGHHTLWVGTLRGLSYVRLATLQAGRYDAGIEADEVLSLYCDEADRLYAGTVNSLISVQTTLQADRDRPPPVYITYIRTEDTTREMPREVSLPYKARKLTIGFIGLSYGAPDRIRYKYRIENLDGQWHYTGNTSIELPSLPPGDYTFLVSGSRDGKDWGPGVPLAIQVQAPLWRTWWFITLVLLGVGALLFLLTRRYTLWQEARKRRQLSVYNKIVYLKQQALSALINPHFIFNCMNSIQHYLNDHDNEKANGYLADFAHLIRITLEDAREAFIPLEKEVERISLYLSLEQLRFGGLQYQIDNEVTLPGIRIPNMILQPYIENAIWHGIMPKGGRGRICVRFRQAGDEIRILVEDDGVGIGNGNNGSVSGNGHYGMRLTAKRLQLLRQLSGQYFTVKVRNRQEEPQASSGTVVEIIVPARPQDEALVQYEQDLQGPLPAYPTNA